MATQLNFEEQEQLDQLKAVWNRYGSLVTWLLIIVLASYAGWNGWNWWHRGQAVKAGSMFDALDNAVQAGDADSAGRIFVDMKTRFPRTTFTQQAGLLAAKIAYDKGRLDAARADLTWVSENASEGEYRSVARLRLAGLLLDEKKYDEALKQLDAATAPSFAGLVEDRRGDVLLAQGKREDAKAAYQKAWAAVDPKVDYRRLIEAKLNTLGVDPAAAAPVAAKSAASAASAK